ncbi:MAG: class I SAM-dependent methyltransferase [Patescibacteria group bacterium]|jgi:SAM-dependent methyltransferase
MRNILEGYKIFNIDPKQLRNKDFFRNVLEYRKFVMDKFPDAVRKTEEFKCLLCGSSNGKEFLKYKNYPLFECLDCGMVSPNVDLSKVDEKLVYDSETALQDVKNDVINNYDYRKKTYAPERLNYILEKTGLKKEEVRLLDVGCGPGYLLEHLKESGVNYKGLELADFLVEICKGRGLNVEKSDLANEPDGAYNIITLFDVLEHLRVPIEMFKTLNKKLEAGGYVLAYTPNIHSIAFHLMGGLQNNVYPYIHLCFFDPRSLDYLAKKTGFEVQSIDYYGLDVMDYLSYKNYEDDYDYLGKLKEFIPVMQAVIDKGKISNHQRIIFKKI